MTNKTKKQMNKAQMKKAKGGIYKGRPAAAAGGGTQGSAPCSLPGITERVLAYVGENLGYGTGGCRRKAGHDELMKTYAGGGKSQG